MLDKEKAKAELGTKSLKDVQRETAWTWASRAAVSYENCLSATGSKKLVCWSVAEEYYHEAVEHAALVDGEDLVAQVKTAIAPDQERAAQDMDRTFGDGQTDNI